MPGSVRIVEHPAALRALLSGPQGGVARDLARRAVRVQTAARVNATGKPGIGGRNPTGRGPKVDTGRLRSSIGWEIRRDGNDLEARIGTNVEYGYYLETGLRNGATYPFLVPALASAR